MCNSVAVDVLGFGKCCKKTFYFFSHQLARQRVEE